MYILLFLLCAILSALTVRKAGLASPSSLFSCVTTFTLLPFTASFTTGTEYEEMTRAGFNPARYGHAVFEVYAIYILLTGLTLLSVLGLKRTAEPRTPAGRRPGGGTKFNYNFVNYPMILLIAFLLFHFLLIDKSLLWSNSQYLTINTPQAMGLESAPLVVLHQALGPLCIAAACACYVFLTNKRTFSFVLSLIIFSYCFLIMLAEFSRFTALSLGVVTVLSAGSRRSASQRLPSPATIALGALTFWLFVYSLVGRSGSEFGLAAVLPSLFESWFDSERLLTIVMNVSIGPYVLAEAITQGPVRYPESYQLLSFSPFPSFIDGFNNLLNLYEERVNWFTPFNAFAELYYFRWYYKIFFALVFAACMRIQTKVVLALGGGVGFLVVAPGIFSLFYMQQYPIRNSFRLLLLSTGFAALALARAKVVRRRAPAATPRLGGDSQPPGADVGRDAPLAGERTGSGSARPQ